ncbi:hypothetical protein, partial [Psychromarinibacter sediminicola]|uniref:hypothetical protein n=1 Tax=Psychromarinibacter sediminicola TaxID=3033385 RepID=UPI0023BA4A0E
DEGTPCAFVLADALYGSDHRFRRMLEDRGQPPARPPGGRFHHRLVAMATATPGRRGEGPSKTV